MTGADVVVMIAEVVADKVLETAAAAAAEEGNQQCMI